MFAPADASSTNGAPGWEEVPGCATRTAALAVPNFLGAFNISQAAAGIAEKALLVLPMVLLIIASEIDLSVASILALCSVVLGLLIQAQVPLGLAIAVVLLVGAAAGALNGWMVAALGHSLVQPSVNLRPMAQAISNSPAIVR